ncbi:MAG: acyl-CoA dehydrogenase family protein [Gemmatimonadetes bacterium]|nr:acyl-CoA dehydrogenase family protein [Gemmatimonadota bacterium]
MPEPRAVRAFLDDAHVELATRLSAFCDRAIAPLPAPTDDDAARRQARELLRLLGQGNLLEPIAKQDLRGLCLTREALAAASPLADAVCALQALGTTPLLLAGSAELRDRWAAPALRGEAMAAFAMTEPEAGSDVAALQTRARRDGGHYVLTGVKTLISNAGIADFYTVFAATDAAAGNRGITCFVVPADAPGLRFVRPQVLSAPHPLGEIAFEDCRVPARSRLGDEGAGFRLGMATLDRVRPSVAAAACGMAARALAEALAHATTRRQFGQPLAEFELVQEKLARMATDLDAARLLVYRAAWEKDRGAERITLEAAMAKAFATEAAQRIVDDAVQILGGRGVLADHPVDRLYRSVRALRIYEGTTEIQHLVIASSLVREAKAAGPATSEPEPEREPEPASEPGGAAAGRGGAG